MDYDFFHALTLEEAQAYLARFLQLESKAIEQMQGEAREAGVPLDFSTSSVPVVLKWLMKRMQAHRIPVPATEPSWIREAHKDGLIEFDDHSKALILRGAYYLGESFAQADQRLFWDLGDAQTMDKNMPVIRGFRSGMAMPPLPVVLNVCRRVLGDGLPATDADEMVAVWLGHIQ